ncbi:TetR family transcriptional regulator [Microlunatus sp. Gsoil 973]|uniref:TetR/AcrR family transcriptional regulator n=1 Tax=Microlunatus sp. Gsoil 973 TaxID=2672569 RepID=UPI0012B4C40C|nr:TetR family transcriptional regulator [Microlunatus sp. Gsoil 973]QGN32740.1 TetR family transcriptional regulator [Microlunatus sp. Gsoil 973]
MVPGIRAQQKEQTRQRIAEAAARLFGERGFDRTSVRDIASTAGVDPALVLHYFGNKRALFGDVMGEPGDGADLAIDDAADFVLNSLTAKLDERATGALAQLRSMLTNEDAREHARAELTNLARLLSEALPGEDRDARAHLLLATNLGVAIARELLQVEPLTDRSPADVAALLRPAVEGLVRAADPPDPT